MINFVRIVNSTISTPKDCYHTEFMENIMTSYITYVHYLQHVVLLKNKTLGQIRCLDPEFGGQDDFL